MSRKLLDVKIQSKEFKKRSKHVTRACYVFSRRQLARALGGEGGAWPLYQAHGEFPRQSLVANAIRTVPAALRWNLGGKRQGAKTGDMDVLFRKRGSLG